MEYKKSKNKILIIKRMIKKECSKSKNDFMRTWFYKNHLLVVEKFCKELLKRLPKADKKIVMLGVWLHDLQRIRGINGDHQRIGAREAEKVMKEFGYSDEIIKKVKGIILTHSCYGTNLPKTVEGKILASADAMSHYVNDFFLTIAVTGKRNSKDFKSWALEKIDRNYNKKIFFPFAKKMIKKRHDALKFILTMK